VIADLPYGDPNHTVVVDAHHDAIFGAGMLDNASGSVSPRPAAGRRGVDRRRAPEGRADG
jgi:hypothetical protein